MWPTSYSKRLAGEIDKWLANGWVTPENATAIRASLKGEEKPSRLPVIITVLGAVLIGFSAMAFVSANWTEMSKALRLSLLAIIMWGAYGLAAVAYFRQQQGFAEAALLVGIGMFGASIMLIGQMYHLPSDFSVGLLLWSLGALITAWAVRSKSALIATQLLLMGWTSYYLFRGNLLFFGLFDLFDGDLHFAYLAPWAAAALLAISLNWAPAKHLAVIGFFFWLFGNAPSFAENIGSGPIELLSIFAAFLTLLWLGGLFAEQKGIPFARALQGYGALAALVFFWIAHTLNDQPMTGINLVIPLLACSSVFIVALVVTKRVREVTLIDAIAFAAFPAGILLTGVLFGSHGMFALWFSAPLFLILCIWLIVFATRQNNRFLINLGFAGFGAEALYLYLTTFGTFLDTAVFFALGGALLIAGGFFWERLRRRATAPQKEVRS